MEPTGREPAPGQRASPLHQVALHAQTQTLYPGCGQGPQERNGNLRFEVRKQDVIGEQWSTGVGEGIAVPAGLKGSLQVSRSLPLTRRPLFPRAIMPAHPTQPSSSDYPCPANIPPSPSKPDKVAAQFLQSYIIAAQSGVRIKQIYIEM